MNRQQLKEKAKNLLPKSGVYRMLNAKGELLYIGKSKCLNKRVASYFQQTSIERSRKIQMMLRQVADFQVYYTDTEMDALLLECRWIQQQKPPYNTQLTKVGRYRYFQIEGSRRYQLRLRKQPKDDAKLTIGPFPSRRFAERTYQMIQLYYPEFFPQSALLKEKGLSQTLPRLYEDALESFEKECLRNPKTRIDKMQLQMQQYADEWAYEAADKVLKAIETMRYLQYLHQLTTVEAQAEWIGVLPVEGSFDMKYYYIKQGLVVATIKAPSTQQAEVVAVLKAKHATSSEPAICLPTPENIDLIRLVLSFKQRGMHVIDV